MLVQYIDKVVDVLESTFSCVTLDSGKFPDSVSLFFFKLSKESIQCVHRRARHVRVKSGHLLVTFFASNSFHLFRVLFFFHVFVFVW